MPSRRMPDLREFVESIPRCAPAWVRDRLGRRRYRTLREDELKATRRGETVFVFGSGWSLNALTDEDWRAIEQHETVSFRDFPRQDFVRADYHVTGEVADVDSYGRRLRENPRYANTVFVVQEGWSAYQGNRLVGRGLLPRGARVFRYKRVARGLIVPFSRSFAQGLVHGSGSIVSVTNFAYLMGWKRIVLVGVDLNDNRYFWLGRESTRPEEERVGLTYADPFPAADRIAETLGRWRETMAGEGVELFVMSRSSHLVVALPIYDANR